jgi:CubicO group peptidase (beta-lactamase class C family)
MLGCNGADYDREPMVDAFVKGKMAEHQIPGVSVAVVRDGRVVLAKGY